MADLTDAQRRELQSRYDALELIADRLETCICDVQESDSREQLVANLRWLDVAVRDFSSVVWEVRKTLTLPDDEGT